MKQTWSNLYLSGLLRVAQLLEAGLEKQQKVRLSGGLFFLGIVLLSTKTLREHSPFIWDHQPFNPEPVSDLPQDDARSLPMG